MIYIEQQKMRYMEKISDILSSLPPYVSPYINSILARKDTSFRTAYAYAYALKIFFRYISENLHENEPGVEFLSSLLPRDIETYIGTLVSYETDEDREHNRKCAPHMKKHYHHMSASARAQNLAAVRGLYKHLIKNQMLSVNPAALASTPVVPKKEVIAMNRMEAVKMVENVKESKAPLVRTQFAERQQTRDACIVSLLLYTGMRISELVGINKQDIHKEDNSVTVIRKGGRKETLYYGDNTASSIETYLSDPERKDSEDDPDALFVSRKGTRISVSAVERMVHKYSVSATYKHITPHKLRSTYATNLYENTHDAMKVKDALGHSSMGVVQKYIDRGQENRKEAADDVNYSDQW